MRHIQQKMIDFLDAKLAQNGLAQHAIQTGNARQLMIEAAKVCVGIREATGDNDGPMVELIQSTVGGHDHESWCMSFVQTMLAYAETKTGKKSPLLASESCDDVFVNCPYVNRVKYHPLAGAIVIWGHYDAKGNYSGGHTGIVLDADEKIFHAVEGNTNGGEDPNGKVVREGGGVYFTNRSMKSNGDMRVRGFLIPF